MGIAFVQAKGTIITNPAVIGFIGVIVGSLLTGLLSFFAQRRADERRHKQEVDMQKLRWRHEDEQSLAETRARVYEEVWRMLKLLQTSRSIDDWKHAQELFPRLQIEISSCGSPQASEVAAKLVDLVIEKHPGGPRRERVSELNSELDSYEKEFWQVVKRDLDINLRETPPPER